MSAFNEDNLSRMGPAQPGNETPVKVTITNRTRKLDNGREYLSPHCEVETLHWSKVGSNIHGIFVPLMSLVKPHTIRTLLKQVALAHDGTLGKTESRVYEIVAARGRCVEVRSHHWSFAPWKELAWRLIGTGNPCEDFHVSRSNTLFARLKTAEQVTAEYHVSSFEFDAVVNRWPREATAQELAELADVEDGANDPTRGFEKFMLEVESEPAPAAPARAVRKKKVPDGAATFVMKAMQPDKPVDIDELVKKVVPTVPPKIDKEGKNRTARYVRAAVDKLVELELLYLHNGTQVSLTALKQGDADGSF